MQHPEYTAQSKAPEDGAAASGAPDEGDSSSLQPNTETVEGQNSAESDKGTPAAPKMAIAAPAAGNLGAVDSGHGVTDHEGGTVEPRRENPQASLDKPTPGLQCHCWV